MERSETSTRPSSGATAGYELLDVGAGRRLERFGDQVVDRPHPGALLSPDDPELWRQATLRFDRRDGWMGAKAIEPWTVVAADVTVELRATDSGGIGLFPEQLENIDWLERQVRMRAKADPGVRPGVLNLFAHTGLMTLVAARAGAAVTHVDASRTAVAWARHNAELSALQSAPIRWLVDDALGYVRREGRRGRRYAGILLDPPSYGHAGRRPWRLGTDLPDLLAACAAIAEDGAFLLLTAHSTGVEAEDLASLARESWPRGAGIRPGIAALELEATSGARLPLGTAIRIPA